MDIIDVDADQPDDDEVFVVNQVKPINNLTISQALLIKHNVIHSLQSKDSVKFRKIKSYHKEKVKTDSEKTCSTKTNKVENLRQEKLHKVRSNMETNSPTLNGTNLSKSNSSGHKKCKKNRNELSSEFQENTTKNNCLPKVEKKKLEAKNEENHIRNIELSPGIARNRKKFKLGGSDNKTSLSPKRNSIHKIFSPKKSSPVQFINQKNTSPVSLLDNKESFDDEFYWHNCNEKFDGNGELLCFLMKSMISDVTRRQMNLEDEVLENENAAGKLFSFKECDILEQFCKLDDIQSKVFVRLLCRSKLWHRLSTIVFKDISIPLENIFEALHEINFVDKNFEEESLESQMCLLNKKEVQNICKLFMVSGKLNSSGKKTQLIKLLIESTRTQKSVINMFKKENDSSITDKLQREVSKQLGTCITINKTVKATFNKVILLFSFPHYFDEEEKRLRSQLYMQLSVHKKYVKYPEYKLTPAVVFKNCEDFEIYNEALMLQEEFLIAINLKKYEEFILITKKAKEEFKNLLISEKYIERYNTLKSFLKRFSGGHIYAKLLTKFCSKFKTKSNIKEIINVAQMLLAQNLFLPSKRGKWYEILSQSLESIRQIKEAAEVLINAHKDPHVDEVQKLVLQLRGQALLKKKTLKVENYIRELLDDVSTISIQEPPSIIITGKALEGNKSGFKTVYIEKTDNGKMFTSVEERALIHYKTNHFPKGCHVEGYVVQSLYTLLFFDIIYGTSPEGVFLSSFQEVPLDLYTEYFYLNRKDALDNRLMEMSEWTEEEAELRLKSAYNKNYNTLCLIAWKEHFTADLLCEIMKCITLPTLTKICRKLILNYRVAKPGFPDLTLWNPDSKKCKFVEVKSPNDKLSPAQRIWLAYLREIGVDCEVCNVKNVSRQLVL